MNTPPKDGRAISSALPTEAELGIDMTAYREKCRDILERALRGEDVGRDLFLAGVAEEARRQGKQSEFWAAEARIVRTKSHPSSITYMFASGLELEVGFDGKLSKITSISLLRSQPQRIIFRWQIGRVPDELLPAPHAYSFSGAHPMYVLPYLEKAQANGNLYATWFDEPIGIIKRNELTLSIGD